MKIILGGGIAGLIIANNKKDSIVIEQQPKLGGIFAYDELLDLKIPFHPPLLDSHFDYFELKKINLRIFSKKEKFILNKLKVQEIPKWLFFNEQMYYAINLPEKIKYLSKNVRVLHSNVKRIVKDKIITNNGVLNAEEIYSTISRKYIDELFGKRSELRSVSFVELIAIVSKRERSWDIYINGDEGVAFSHIINAYWISDQYDVLYVLVPFMSSPPVWDKIYSDLKRERIITKDEIVGFRSRIIRDGILIGEENDDYIGNIKMCGRLGKWKNFTLIETILDSLKC